MSGLVPKGYKCICGVEHIFPTWVYAHWDDTLYHTCKSCDSRNVLEQGIFTRVAEKDE